MKKREFCDVTSSANCDATVPIPNWRVNKMYIFTRQWKTTHADNTVFVLKLFFLVNRNIHLLLDVVFIENCLEQPLNSTFKGIQLCQIMVLLCVKRYNQTVYFQDRSDKEK